jgi:molecular chaperone DnaJ
MFGRMQQQSACNVCGGKGTTIKNKCQHCSGTGVVNGEEVVEVQIPAGVQDGMILTVQGKGNAGQNNGYAGDIQVYVEVEQHSELSRRDNDLVYNLLLDLPTAVLGGPAEIPTIDGRVKIKIEPGTQPGKTVRLRGKGLPALQGYGYGYGDLIVNISIYIPETLTKEEHEAFEKMKGSDSFMPSQSTKNSFFQKFKNLFS